jgi:DNA-binding beta-propeller fold protein YncE
MWHARCVCLKRGAGVVAGAVVRGALVSGAFVFAAALAQPVEEASPAGGGYVLDRDFFKLPDGRPTGSTAGIAIDPDGRSIWIFDRCGGDNCVGSDVAPIMKFDASGNWVKSFGAGLFVRPHGLYVDAEGNVWVTDGEGPDGVDPRRDGKGHRVMKFSPDGEVLMTLGTAGVAGDGPNEFNQPSAVVVAPNGDIFVADGHGGQSNARIVKFSKDGAYLKAWGHKGTGPGEFSAPHAIAIDAQGRVFVGDRGNNRIQIFDQDGNFLDEWTQFGNPSGVYIDGNDILYVTEIGMNSLQGPDWKQGVRIGDVAGGVVTTFIGDPDERSTQEGVTADAAGNVYASLTIGMALRKYERVAR